MSVTSSVSFFLLPHVLALEAVEVGVVAELVGLVGFFDISASSFPADPVGPCGSKLQLTILAVKLTPQIVISTRADLHAGYARRRRRVTGRPTHSIWASGESVRSATIR